MPVPVLAEERRAGNCNHALVPGARAQRYGAVTAAGVEHTRREKRAQAHDGLTTLQEGLRQLLAEGLDLALGARWVRHLLQHHARRDVRCLAHKVRLVSEQRLKQRVRGRDLVAAAGAGNADGHGGAVAHIRVVRLGQQRHKLRHLLRGVDQHKAERRHGGAAHVVGGIRHGGAQQTLHR